MRLVVTGVGGFVGGIAARTLARGHEVVGCYRATPPVRPDPAMRLVRTDLRDPQGLPDRYDWLVHCAAAIPAVVPDPEELRRTNVESSRRLFDHAVGAGARGIVFMSSMAAFGRIVDAVVHEATPPREPGVYGASKLEGERLLAERATAHGLRTASIRLPGVVGRGSHDNFLSDVGAKIVRGDAVAASHPDAPFNNIVHIADLCALLAVLMDGLPVGHRVLTLGAAEPLTIRAMLQHLFAACGRPEQLTFKPATQPTFTIGFEAARALGYRPRTVAASLDDFAADLLAH